MRSYLCVYSFKDGMGSIEVTDFPFTKSNHKKLKKWLEETYKIENVIIMNLIKFEEEKDSE